MKLKNPEVRRRNHHWAYPRRTDAAGVGFVGMQNLSFRDVDDVWLARLVRFVADRTDIVGRKVGPGRPRSETFEQFLLLLYHAAELLAKSSPATWLLPVRGRHAGGHKG